jgi:hypothetical protein
MNRKEEPTSTHTEKKSLTILKQPENATFI